MIPWECGREGQLAVPPHFRRHMVATSFRPSDGGWPAGHWTTRRGSFLPALRRVFTTGRETAFPAPGGSLCSRDLWVLVSVNALPSRIRSGQ